MQIASHLLWEFSGRNKYQGPRSWSSVIIQRLLSPSISSHHQKHKTHSLGAQYFLYDRDTISSRLPTACSCPGEDITTFKTEWDCFGLYESGPSETHICQGSQETIIKEMREWRKCRIWVDQSSFCHGWQSVMERSLKFACWSNPPALIYSILRQCRRSSQSSLQRMKIRIELHVQCNYPFYN